MRSGRRTVKGVAGYDLARVCGGSEGPLGVLTDAEGVQNGAHIHHLQTGGIASASDVIGGTLLPLAAR